MTAREHAFATRIIAGDGPSKAYLAAGYTPQSNGSLNAIAANRVLNRPHVAAMIAEARKQPVKAAHLTRERSLAILRSIAEAKSASNRDKISAIERAAKMSGYDAPDKVELKVEGSLLYQIRN